MVRFNELSMTSDGNKLIVEAEVPSASFYENVYIDTMSIDTEETFKDTGPSGWKLFSYKETLSETHTEAVKLLLTSEEIKTNVLNYFKNTLCKDVLPIHNNVRDYYIVGLSEGLIEGASKDVNLTAFMNSLQTTYDLYGLIQTTVVPTEDESEDTNSDINANPNATLENVSGTEAAEEAGEAGNADIAVLGLDAVIEEGNFEVLPGEAVLNTVHSMDPDNIEDRLYWKNSDLFLYIFSHIKLFKLVSNIIRELPITLTALEQNSLYYGSEEDIPTEMLTITTTKEVWPKKVRNIIDLDGAGNHLYFITVNTVGRPNLNAPCGLRDRYIIGVAYNKYYVYKLSMDMVDQIEGCSINRELIDYILRLESMDLAIKIGNFKLAKYYWSIFNKKKIGTSLNCKCHG